MKREDTVKPPAAGAEHAQPILPSFLPPRSLASLGFYGFGLELKPGAKPGDLNRVRTMPLLAGVTSSPPQSPNLDAGDESGAAKAGRIYSFKQST